MSSRPINDLDRKQIGEMLQTLDDRLRELGAAGIREAVSGLDVPDHLWLAIEALCLPQHQRDRLIHTLLRFKALEIVPLIDGTVLLRSSLDEQELEIQSVANLIGRAQRPDIKPSRARRRVLQRDRLFAVARGRS